MSQTSRHSRDLFHIEGEGLVGLPAGARTNDEAARAAAANFRFTRIGPVGTPLPRAINVKVSAAMTAGTAIQDGTIPAGYTYLGQLVDHDFTFDRTSVMFGADVSPAEMLQGRSPKLDLDCLYGGGPADPVSAKFYSDASHLKVGRTTRAAPGPKFKPRDGYDLPRKGDDGPKGPRRVLIPDQRNDENLAVAQTHSVFIRLHNRVVDTLASSVPVAQRFREARRSVVLHYQWLLKTDYLPRICDPNVVTDVFDNGRKVFDVGADPVSMPAMPVEFSVAAFRLGHSMVRNAYDWNAVFNRGGGTLDFLFNFSGTSGFLGEGSASLPSNWVADWRRLYRFASIGRNDLKPPRGEFNLAQVIDTKVARGLNELPLGSFGGTDADFGTLRRHLAFRNLTRAGMVKLASGQQMAALLSSKGVAVTPLTRAKILRIDGGTADLSALTPAQRDTFAANTPLWFYILREAELNDGKLTGVGARLVVETFHRAMEASRFSIVRTPTFRPTLSGVPDRFTMMDLLLFAFNNDPDAMNPLGNEPV